MPDRSKIRWSQLKVGIVALIAMAIAVTLIFLLTSSKGVFQHNVLLRTYMNDASAIREGTPVQLNGVPIGYVDAVSLTNNSQRPVEFVMMVNQDSLKDIPVDSQTSIAAANLLGDKFINITRGVARQTVKPGDVLMSVEAQDIPQLMNQMAGLLQSFQGIVGRVDNLLAGVEQGKGNLGLLLKDRELYDRLNAIASEGQQLLTDVRTGKGTLSKLIYDDQLYNDVRAPVKRIDTMLADLQNGQGTAGKLLKDPALFNDTTQVLNEMKALIADLNAGKGTAGALLKNDDLHQRLDGLLTKLNTTLDKVDSGQGTIGQLVVNPQLYQELTQTTAEFQGLAKDLRTNPKKFLRIKLAIF